MRMEKPTVEAVRFNTADVIATSGGVPAGKVLLSGFGNTDANDNTFQIGTTTYGPNQGSNDFDTLMSALEEQSGSVNSGYFKISGSYLLYAHTLWSKDDNDWGAITAPIHGTIMKVATGTTIDLPHNHIQTARRSARTERLFYAVSSGSLQVPGSACVPLCEARKPA